MSDLIGTLNRPGTVLLDGSDASGDRGVSLLFSSPRKILSCSVPADVPHLLDELDRSVAGGLYAAGYLGYECGYAFEPRRFDDLAHRDWGDQIGYPIFWMGLYEAPEEIAPKILDEAFRPRGVDIGIERLELAETTTRYKDQIANVRSLIHEGDVYQVNYTGRFKGGFSGGAHELYGMMRTRQPVSFGAFIQLGDVQILSASPECFFSRYGDRIRVRPMKGTAPRGQTEKEDKMLFRWLETDEKSRAENLMIVDLLRNDLSIVCEPGTVRVPDLYRIEEYKTVLQMTSTVVGRLKSGARYADLFRALFPCGSITGAPKIRAMRRIFELEKEPRGVYCGAIGYVSPRNRASFSVAIRTLSLINSEITLGSGGGIVWDSNPPDELEECLVKTRFLTRSGTEEETSIRIIETMRWENGVDLLERHLDRLEKTALRLGFEYVQEEAVRTISDITQTLSADSSYRVRLLLDRKGGFEVSSTPLSDICAAPVRIGIAQARVHSEDPFLRIKTTHRVAQKRALEEAVDLGLDEMLLLNEREEITEGTITNVFLLIAGVWYTPPVSSGLLAGIGRQLMIESVSGIVERPVSVEDLRRSERIVLTNAVRGSRDGTLILS